MKRLIPIFLLASCSTPHKHFVSIDSDFRPYVENFKDSADFYERPIKIDDLLIKFGSASAVEPNAVGVCFPNGHKGHGTPEIWIDKDFWKTADEDLRANLFFHEMGHCVLLQDHREYSIMEPYVQRIFPNFGYYLNDLFSYKKQDISMFGFDKKPMPPKTIKKR